jgi:hypothetical protein
MSEEVAVFKRRLVALSQKLRDCDRKGVKN